MTDVKIFRLSTGEDVIGQKLEESNENLIHIKQAFVIVPMQSKPGGPVQLALTPYMPYAEGDVIVLKTANIITEAEPKLDITNSYNSHLGTGIVQLKKPKLIID